MIINIILSIVLIFCLILTIYKYWNLSKEDNEIKEYNNKLINRKIELEKEIEISNILLNSSIEKNKKYNEDINNQLQQLDKMQETTREAFKKYCEVLDKEYISKEDQNERMYQNLKSEYIEAKSNLYKEVEKIVNELDEMKKTRVAAIEAKRREKELAAQKDFYCLQLSDAEVADISRLEGIRAQFSQPRTISMLIWTSFVRAAANIMINNVIGDKKVCGIYKITNLTDDSCYIGQSVDIGERWRQHIKCGIGIDTPANNKLYKTMQKDKIWNFSFELIEECPKELLNEKEKFYIDLYCSAEAGMNTLKGNN